jgi:glycine cleavage system aminomethyltransferase T
VTFVSLEDAIQKVGNPVEMLRNSPYPAFEFPVNPEFTNWRSEQTAWRNSCALLDQSHHMDDLFLSGPDALRLLSEHAVNTFGNFPRGSAKQYIATNNQGYMIGDSILFHMEDGRYDLVGNPSVINWLLFHIEKDKYNVTADRCENSTRRKSGPPRLYRYEIQGPTAAALMEKVTGAALPPIKFFKMHTFTIAGRRVQTLRHGMAGQAGFEMFGPWEEGTAVLESVLKAGEEFGLVRAGAKAYSTANLESGWIPKPPVTAIFGEDEKAYRQWLPARSIGSLAGSMDSRNIFDYYVTPYDQGLGRMVSFDHDFKGADALRLKEKDQKRTKVTLVWNKDDVLGTVRSQYEPGLPAKSIDVPKARYGFFQADKVMHAGSQVGISMDVGYIHNERVLVSLATLNKELSEPGTEVSVLWGEKPNSRKPGVEPHCQVEIRATVAPAPYVREIRDAYRKS